MKKSNFLRFIEKYHLGGIVESVKWDVKSKTLDVKFISEDMVLIGHVTLKDMDMEDTEFGIYTTSELLKMFSALETEIKVDVVEYEGRPVNMLFTDDKKKSVYILSDPAIIPKSATPKKMPDFNVVIDLNEEFIDTYIKCKNALADTSSFAIQGDGDEAEIIIGYSDNNTNRTSWKEKATVNEELLPIMFNAEYFKSVLMANKNMTKGKMSVSSAGLMMVEFEEGDYTSKYFMVQLQQG
jgi:hypothetical protein